MTDHAEREARNVLVSMARGLTPVTRFASHSEIDKALDAYRDALLDAVDEDVAGLRQTHPTIAGIAYDAGITDARAAIRARKETT